MFEIFKNRLEIIGILENITALRISAGRSTEPIGSDLPVIKDALGRPLIPGSSFKGALRSRLESFLRAIHLDFAANPAQETDWSIPPDMMSEFKEQIKNLKPQEKEEELHSFIINKTDLVSSLFGSPWLASKFQIRDLTVSEPENNWFGQYQERDGVAIDRDTETAGDGKLYDFQVVPAGTPFIFHAVIENAEEWELGMLMIGLHQFQTEQIPLGGGRSRGLGVVKLIINDMKWVDVRDENYKRDKSYKPQTDPQKVKSYLKALIDSNSNPTSPYIDAQPLKKLWADTFINHLSIELHKRTNTTANSSLQNHA
ncbi:MULTISPECIES: CRISPR-associated RAMP protein Csx7 [unclassified Nostoc]|uniref:type III CRISPR-associated RAMP protein Csx7 n=1 Tax=unclassified Nostoc TaxID=2593658 RepID=UPI002AD49802|nr:CRISPR-associated RAMP protein Csx7 [Nostoc sp. DedQUE03]MDZ7973415.1 CRISPR-associated RAMP protein Csx7 [Nostoc sp. DedQUE03]MDZ8045310.1 CRISPR-associated RAMP protein Csx7 [Nostoc sp. DedQUE02]